MDGKWSLSLSCWEFYNIFSTALPMVKQNDCAIQYVALPTWLYIVILRLLSSVAAPINTKTRISWRRLVDAIDWMSTRLMHASSDVDEQTCISWNVNASEWVSEWSLNWFTVIKSCSDSSNLIFSDFLCVRSWRVALTNQDADKCPWIQTRVSASPITVFIFLNNTWSRKPKIMNSRE